MAHLYTGALVASAVFAAAVLSSSVASAQTSCLNYPSNSTPPNGYGASWDVFDSAKALLVKTDCPTSGNTLNLTVGKGSATQYVWSTVYVYRAGGWVDQTLPGDTGGWIAGQGSKSITAPADTSSTNPLYLVGYVCTNRGAAGWKCGCSDSACAVGKWQLQAYTGNSGSGTTGTGTTGGTTGGTGGTGSAGTGFVKVAKSQCLTRFPSTFKPFSAGTHTETSGSGAAFSIDTQAGKTTDLRGVTLQSYQNAYQGPPSISEVKNYNDACIIGPRLIGLTDPYNTNWASNHDWGGRNISFEEGKGPTTLENAVIKNTFQDSVTLPANAPKDLDFSMRGIWMIHNDDDWLENDSCHTLNTIEDILVDQTRQGISMRPGGGSSAECPNFRFTLRNSLINHICVKGTDGDGITSDSCPQGYKQGQFFKLSGTSMSKVSVDMENVLFRMESMPVKTCKQIEEQQFNNASTYKNVVVVWDPKDGSTAWPNCDLPSGWSVKTGAEGRNLWNTARQEWLDKHGCNEATATCTFPNSY